MFQDRLAPLQQVNNPKRRDSCEMHCPDILFVKISSESRSILGIFVNFVGFHEYLSEFNQKLHDCAKYQKPYYYYYYQNNMI